MDRAKPFDRNHDGTLDSRRTAILWQKEQGHPEGKVHKQTPDGRMQEVTDPKLPSVSEKNLKFKFFCDFLWKNLMSLLLERALLD